MAAGAFFRRRDHRRGRAPWPGPHPDPAGRARGLHATGARAGPAAGGNGSAALCLISLISRPIQGWPMAASPARLAGSSGNRTDPGRRGASPESGGRVEFRQAAIGHPKVLPAWRGDSVRESGPLPGPATASARLAARLAARRAAIPTLQPAPPPSTPAQPVFARAGEPAAAGPRRVEFAVERLHQPGQATERDAPRWNLGCPHFPEDFPRMAPSGDAQPARPSVACPVNSTCTNRGDSKWRFTMGTWTVRIWTRCWRVSLSTGRQRRLPRSTTTTSGL